MDDLDALWAFLVAGAWRWRSPPPPPRSPTGSARSTCRASAGCTTSRLPAWAGWRSWPGCCVAGVVFLPWNGETRGILGGAAAIALIGAVDDIREGGLPPW